jgi:hypothetical protein
MQLARGRQWVLGADFCVNDLRVIDGWGVTGVRSGDLVLGVRGGEDITDSEPWPGRPASLGGGAPDIA